MPDRRDPLTKDERDLHREVQLKNLDGHLGIEAEHHAAIILRLLDQVEGQEDTNRRFHRRLQQAEGTATAWTTEQKFLMRIFGEANEFLLSKKPVDEQVLFYSAWERAVFGTLLGKVEGLEEDKRRLDWLEKSFDGGAVVSDDDYRWACVMDGMQNMPETMPGNIDVQFWIEKDKWKPNIRAAIDHAIEDCDE